MIAEIPHRRFADSWLGSPDARGGNHRGGGAEKTRGRGDLLRRDDAGLSGEPAEDSPALRRIRPNGSRPGRPDGGPAPELPPLLRVVLRGPVSRRRPGPPQPPTRRHRDEAGTGRRRSAADHFGALDLSGPRPPVPASFRIERDPMDWAPPAV